MQKFNIVTSKSYKAKDGTDKKQWNTVGTLIATDKGMFMELYMYPETRFSVFEQKPRDAGQINELPPSF